MSQAQLLDDSATDQQRSRPASAGRLSELLWGIDWNRTFPCVVTEDGIVAEWSDYDSAVPFVKAHYPTIFEQDEEPTPFRMAELNEAKARYYREVGDFFAFKDGAVTVGLFICAPVDWSTYYFRNTAVLLAYQDRGIAQGFFRKLAPALIEGGVQRVETDTSPSNLRMMHVMAAAGFHPSGTLLSERWGAHVHFTRFLDRQCEEVFLKQFCAGVRPRRRQR